MAIKIKNLRISPYTDKNELKVIFGDEMHLTFEIPHVVGESYLCALDNERVLYPINRPVCAYTNVFTRDEGEVSFTLKLTTSKLRDFVSSIKKPMPVWLQIVREVNGKYETVLLDDILAIPSVIDGNMTVYEGDSFKELLDGKMDVPEAEGTAGQVLTLDADGHYSWQDAQGGEENVQSDWDCSDSESAAFILNKPNLATVATSGSYNDLTDKPVVPEQVQSDWDESDSSATDYIKNKPTLFSGDYNDLSNKPNLATVATSGDYNDLTNKPIITAPVNADWDESDSSDLAYILNKPNLATVATSGSYNDLSNKPVIPTQYDWLCLTANEANSTVYIYKYTNNFDLEYSTNGTTWSAYTWEGTTGQTITLANAGDKVYWRGDNADTCDGGISNLYVQFRMSGSIKATGNVMSLLSKTCSKTEIPKFCFYQLFRGCSALTSANIFGRVKVLSGCGRIFQQCTSLTSIEIPTEVIADHMDMMASAFNGCSSLSRVKVGFHAWFSGTAWLKNVAATGTFICPSDLDCSTRSTSRVPEGWTVERTSAPQADWSESDTSDPSYILNKPTIPAAQVQSDWDESDSSDVSFIKNKPDLAVDENDYLCFTALAANSTISMQRSKSRSGDNPEDKDIEYSTDKKTWSQYQWDNQWNVQASIPTDSGTVITLANVGDKVWFRGNNARWNYQAQIGIGAYIAYKFYFAMSGTIGASGDVVYLASKKGDVKKAINLSNLFQNCTSLVTPPKLGFTELLEDCYNSLFLNCTNLNEVPELKAIKMEKSCYYALFSGCASLQYPPVLASVQLAENCYGYLFKNCTSLKLAPELPASNLVSQCYNRIFEGCTLIDHIKVGFSDWAITGSVESSYKTYNWLSNVSATGVFECPAMLDTSTRDASHIPSGWSVVWTTSVQSDWDESNSTEASYVLNKGISTEVAVSDSAYTVNAGTTVPVITVASALTLSADTVASGKVGYAEVVLDIASAATVTAGSNITFVDTLEAGKRNICVVRWSGGLAKLYVTIVEDLDTSSSI